MEKPRGEGEYIKGKIPLLTPLLQDGKTGRGREYIKGGNLTPDTTVAGPTIGEEYNIEKGK